MTKRRTLTSIDLFAGCGGLSLGLEQAGFKTLAFSELNKDAAATFAANRVEHAPRQFGAVSELLKRGVIPGLLSEFARDGFKRVDLVAGGPPCQGYSGIGHRRSYKVEREEIPSNHLYLDMIKVIRAVQPRMFLFENVRGLMNGRWTADGTPGEIWKDVLRAFENTGDYDVRWALVQAKNYGVPQNRPRVLIVGIHKDQRWTPSTDPDDVAAGLLPRPTGGAPDLVDALDDLVDTRHPAVAATLEYRREAKTEFQLEMRRKGRTVLKKGDPLTEQEYSQHAPRIVEKFKYMLANNGEIPEEMRTKKFAQRVWPRRWGNEGPTITATSLADDFVHYSQPRAPTVREWARLQCFPDWYRFRGPRTTGGLRRAGKPTEGIWDREVPKYTQIGNAVPVRLARAVGEYFAGRLGR